MTRTSLKTKKQKIAPTNALEITNVSKTYSSGTYALQNISLSVPQGSFYALLGYNGAGKSTLIHIISSLVNKSSGTVKVFGLNQDEHPNEVKYSIGLVPQEINFSMFENVIDIVVWQAGYFGIGYKEAMVRAESVLKQLELWDKRMSKSRELSGGMKRRLMIARALMHQPKILLLDEPTAGVDVELRRGMYDYLRSINQSGTTIILTTHYLEEAQELCDTLGIIKDGQLIRQGNMKDMLNSLDSTTYIVEVDTTQNVPTQDQFEISLIDHNTLEIKLSKTQSVNSFIQFLTEQNVTVSSFYPKENRLEELFLSILNQ